MCSLDDRPSKPRHVFEPTGPRLDLPTCPIGSFNGTELPVPGPMCSLDDRPLEPRSVSTFITSPLPTCPIGSFNGTELPVPWPMCTPNDRPSKPRHVFVPTGPRLPTSPIGSFNGTELPVPGPTCSPEDRPRKPRLMWTRRPQCPFNIGNLPPHVACPFPVGLSEHKSIFLDPPADPREPIIDLGPTLDMIPLYLESVVVPDRRVIQPLQRAPTASESFYDSIWFKAGSVVLTILFVYALYLGPPGGFERADVFDIAVDVVVAEYNAASAKVKEIIETFPPLFAPDDGAAAEQTPSTQTTVPTVDVVRVSYWDIVKGTVTGFFAGIARVVATSSLSVIDTIISLFVGIIHVVVCLLNSLTKAIKSIVVSILVLFINLWNAVRNAVKWFFVATSRVVIGAYVAVRNILKGSFKMMKNVMSLPRLSPRRVAEQPISPVVQPTSPSAQAQAQPATNSANVQTVQQPEAMPSNSERSARLRSLSSSVANAIRAGNAAPSQVRRAGGRRINSARPVRATGSSTAR
ncbi:hypothetical protein C0995_010752 [Termitomyces sp. Mi166|nr:hypothetical protein C0995_010752 [Termitomyces sp. Mi166\